MKQLKKLLTPDRSIKRATAKGTFSEWTHFCTLEIKGGALQFTEARVIGLRGNNEYECYEIPVENGPFTIECRVVSFGTDNRISDIRAYPKHLNPASLEKRLLDKEIPVDFGGVAVVDIGTVHQSMEEDTERYEEWYDEALYGSSEGQFTIHTWPDTKTEIPCVDSGFGDGSYPLSELLLNGTPVGLEVTFIQEDEEYPM